MKHKAIKARIFNAVQFEVNPKTGESLHFSEANIKACVAHKSITNYAYIRHDKDVYTKDDEKSGHKAGTPKPPHYHIIMKCENAIELDTVAKWLGIPPQYVEIPKGRGAFLDCVQYLTHESEKEQVLGKYLYADSEITANFDFRAELTKRDENKLKYDRDLDHEQQILYDVMYGGKTIRQVIDEDRIFYMNNYKKVDSARLKYIQQCNPPTMRINYYIEGKGGVGKGLASRAIARSLYPDLEKDDDIFFCIGDGKATFEGYDGQPVIIWNDCRSFELFALLGSRGNIFNVFDIHPQAIRQNVKYSSINLINTVNIVNSVQSYQEFLNGLAGEYNDYKAEDKSQSYRRFPIITLLRQDDISVLLNKGVFEDSIEDFTEYIQYSQLVGNFQKIAQACGNNFPIQRKIESQFMQPVIDKHNELLAKNNQTYTDEELLDMFKDYGKPVPIDPTFPF
ncbi:MAG: Rep family protein [Blautia sp.]|nr:Rep family protein [Blautia sp.]